MHVEKRWVIKPAGDAQKVENLHKSTGILPRLANLLVQRGIETPQQIERFFNPRLEDMHDPFMMKDMLLAVERLDRAIENKERVMVYGDYDVDGTTAVSMVYNFLSKRSEDALFYIPDRYAEGYGISQKGVDYAADNGVSLIIALDCGIKAVSKIDYAKSKGIDFIICDHHLPSDEIPRAVAVLDPKQPDCNYPFKHLSGCGVGFKLLHGYCIYKDLPFSEVESMLDLVVVSIAADIVPIIGENRILAYYGLKRLNSQPNKGLCAIIKMCGLENHNIAVDDIIFKIGPRINAAGRMEIEIDHEDSRAQSGGRTAVRLLTSPTEERAKYYVNRIDNFNSDRKSIDRSITQQAHELIQSDTLDVGNNAATVIYNPSWVKGVVGIVASRLIETYYRPTVVLTMSNGMVTGSARSVPGFDLYQAIEACADLLENFGGHTYAAGLTLKPENVELFRERFTQFVEQNIEPDMLVPKIDIDSELSLDEINSEFRSMLAKFQPFGPGNPAPVFMSKNVCDNGSAKLVGAKREHLKMELIQKKNKVYKPISAIAFLQTSHWNYINGGGMIDICYALVDNLYQGVVSPQLRIKDIKKSAI